MDTHTHHPQQQKQQNKQTDNSNNNVKRKQQQKQHVIENNIIIQVLHQAGQHWQTHAQAQGARAPPVQIKVVGQCYVDAPQRVPCSVGGWWVGVGVGWVRVLGGCGLVWWMEVLERTE